MNSAQDTQNKNVNTTNNSNQTPPISGSAVSSGSKEQAPIGGSVEIAAQTPVEVELPKELKEIGVEQISGTIELPPDVKKLGVTAVNQSQPVVSSPALEAVALPISDDTVVKGTHEGVTNALSWLATWCLKRLRKAHILLKVVHGKIIRVKG
jgi:hypothetical protein